MKNRNNNIIINTISNVKSQFKKIYIYSTPYISYKCCLMMSEKLSSTCIIITVMLQNDVHTAEFTKQIYQIQLHGMVRGTVGIHVLARPFCLVELILYTSKTKLKSDYLVCLKQQYSQIQEPDEYITIILVVKVTKTHLEKQTQMMLFNGTNESPIFRSLYEQNSIHHEIVSLYKTVRLNIIHIIVVVAPLNILSDQH